MSHAEPATVAPPQEASLTTLIHIAATGDATARSRLYERAYPLLHRIARARLYGLGAERDVEATELLNEGYLRFLNAGELHAQDRVSFFSFIGSMLRSIVLDQMRKVNAEKRGGGFDITALSTAIQDSVGVADHDFADIEQAMNYLQGIDARLAQVVDLRFFAGMTLDEVAANLGLNQRTVVRDWEKAQRLLREYLSAK